jgi:phage baseplate assembly protein W
MEDLREQFELESSTTAAMHADFQVLRQVRGLRQQLQALKNRGITTPVTEAITRLEDKLRDLEGVEEGATFLSTPQGRSLARLNIGLTSLLELVDSADARPTTQQSAMFKELKSALEQQLANWEGIKKTDVPALNLKLNQSGLQTLDAESAIMINKSRHSAEKAAGED